MENNVNKFIFQELEEVTRPAIAENIIRSGRNASGRTIRSMHTEMNTDGATLYGRKFFGVLETGRKSGKVPYDFQTLIMQWASDKGITFQTDRERKSFAFLVARKIHNEGTKLFREGGEQDVFTEPIKKSVKTITGIVSAFYAQQTINDIRNGSNGTNR